MVGGAYRDNCIDAIRQIPPAFSPALYPSLSISASLPLVLEPWNEKEKRKKKTFLGELGVRLDVGNKKNRGIRERERERGEEDERHGSPNTVCSFRIGGPCNLFANSGYCGTAGRLVNLLPSLVNKYFVPGRRVFFFLSLLCLSVSLSGSQNFRFLRVRKA